MHFNWRAAWNNHVSDFLGRIFFPRRNGINFCMWPSTSEKNVPPYLSLLVSLSFSANNVCKNAVFFLAVSFQKKALVFQNNRISEVCICRQENLHVCMRYFSKAKNKTAEKITGQCFPVKSKVICKNWVHLEAKKKRPKMSLPWFFHAALQLSSTALNGYFVWGTICIVH